MQPWGARHAVYARPAVGRETNRLLLLTVGLVLYLSGVVLKSPEGPTLMGAIAVGMVMAGLVTSVVFTRVVGSRFREQARQAMEQQDPEALPEQ